ncbi:MAG: hypothetical protein ABDI20_03675 [Candidatus Bipolaricaulaceae bacterium]
MVRALLLAAVFVGSGLGWELTVVFTTDLHTAVARLWEFREVFLRADLVLDGGDAWEDTRRPTGEAEAWETLRAMAALGYTAMVLANHETYLGPRVLSRILAETPFAVLATNLRAPLPTQPWALVEVKGLRVLLLGVLWDLAIVWPGWELLDPEEALEAALAAAPPHDLFILLGHLDLRRAQDLVRRLSKKPALFVLGHNHRVFREPLYVEGVPIVQAGSHGKALGVVRLGPEGVRAYEILQPREALPLGVPASAFAALGLFLVLAVLWRA